MARAKQSAHVHFLHEFASLDACPMTTLVQHTRSLLKSQTTNAPQQPPFAWRDFNTPELGIGESHLKIRPCSKSPQQWQTYCSKTHALQCRGLVLYGAPEFGRKSKLDGAGQTALGGGGEQFRQRVCPRSRLAAAPPDVGDSAVAAAAHTPIAPVGIPPGDGVGWHSWVGCSGVVQTAPLQIRRSARAKDPVGAE